jgi:hypothetical protein
VKTDGEALPSFISPEQPTPAESLKIETGDVTLSGKYSFIIKAFDLAGARVTNGD